jgi:RNA polymerase sigma-70 factor (ECF subfamily)
MVIKAGKMQDERSQLLVRLLTQHHQTLLRYIYALVGNAEDANDILQETSVALFQKLEQFDESRPFLPWAYRFAYFEVLKWRDSAANKPLTLDNDVVELISKDRERGDVLLKRRMDLLPECFRLLPSRDLIAIRARYYDKTNLDELCEKLGLSRRTLFRELERIRKSLMDCIESKLAVEEIY